MPGSGSCERVQCSGSRVGAPAYNVVSGRSREMMTFSFGKRSKGNSATVGSAISIAMATYNGAKYVREQLDSLVCQSLLPAELVVTDDGSTDGTQQIVEDFARTAPFPVRIIRNESRLGYSDNFLKAASLCSSDLIAFCDQDDVWFSFKLEICAAWFSDPEVLLLTHSAELWEGAQRSGALCPGFRQSRVFSSLSLYPLTTYPGFAMIIRRQLLDIADNSQRPVCPFLQKAQAHDQWVWFLASVFGKIVLLRDVLALYRQHRSNAFGGSRNTLGRSLARTIQATDYSRLSSIEAYHSTFLRRIADGVSDKLRGCAYAGAKLLQRRADLNSLRAVIYADRAGFTDRAYSFLRLFLMAGYLPSRQTGSLGSRAAIKDLFYGVPALHRIVRARKRSDPPERVAQ